jgi:hypothetical protein
MRDGCLIPDFPPQLSGGSTLRSHSYKYTEYIYQIDPDCCQANSDRVEEAHSPCRRNLASEEYRKGKKNRRRIYLSRAELRKGALNMYSSGGRAEWSS